MKAIQKQQSGFTLIELIMVIVILGILSAFALPKFADLGGDAREASINGALGAVRAASAIIHAEALASSTTTGNITVEGATINLVNSYADAETIDDAAQITSADYTITATSGTVTTITLGTCSFTYTEAGAGGAAAVSTLSGSTASGC